MSDGVIARLFDADGHDHAIDLSSIELPRALGARRLLWVDIDRQQPHALDALDDLHGLIDLDTRARARIAEDTGRARLRASQDRLHLTLEALDVRDDGRLERHEIDLVAGPDVVVSIHDVSYLEHPEFFPMARRVQLKISVERTVRRAAKILTLSEFSRQGIARSYGLDPDKVAVVPAACSDIFKPVSRAKAKAFVEGRFQVAHPFILCVGDLQPRKNLPGLIRAFEELVGNYPELPHHLVMVGKDTWYASKVHQAAENSPFGNRIHFTGYVDDAELLQIYNACDIFVFPSFYEGFGIPILEAMACGRAVACANTSAMPEVAGSAAVLFNPHSTEEMMTSMRDLLRNAELRARKERLGQQNAMRFSWMGTARQTLEVYYEVAGTRAKQGQPAIAGRP